MAPWDYQLIGGAILAILSIIGIANARVEGRSRRAGYGGLLLALGLIGWAWLLAGGDLGWQSLPDAIFRLIARWW